MNELRQQTNVAVWKEIVRKYQEPSMPRAVWQLVNTLGLYALLWYLMYRSLTISWWLLVTLSIVAGGILTRIFIIFHDCGHGSYFRSRTANDVLGFITGMLWLPAKQTVSLSKASDFKIEPATLCLGGAWVGVPEQVTHHREEQVTRHREE